MFEILPWGRVIEKLYYLTSQPKSGKSGKDEKTFFESVRIFSIFPHPFTSRGTDSSAVVCRPVRVTHLTESERAGNLINLVNIFLGKIVSVTRL